jgi:hypothetical protein
MKFIIRSRRVSSDRPFAASFIRKQALGSISCADPDGVLRAGALWEGPVPFVREEPGKQKPRSCRAQELARSRARENARRKKTMYPTQ